MNRRLLFELSLVGLVILAFLFPTVRDVFSQTEGPTEPPAAEAPEAAASTAFTYQGELKKDGSPYTGTCNLRFKLFSASNGTGQLGATQTINAVGVTGGLFTVSLDFGNQYNGSQRFLETAVQCTGDAGFTALAPLTAVKPAPYSVSSAALRGNSVSDAAPATGDVLTWDGSQWAPAALELRQKYYLTQTTHQGNAALTACAAGYHMASLAEIFNPTELDYETSLGFTQTDSGEGPGTNITGWIRTGIGPITANQIGASNCNAWTSNSNAHYGTDITIGALWSGASVVISPWVGVTHTCDQPRRVWCVQD